MLYRVVQQVVGGSGTGGVNQRLGEKALVVYSIVYLGN